MSLFQTGLWGSFNSLMYIKTTCIICYGLCGHLVLTQKPDLGVFLDNGVEESKPEVFKL